MKKVSIIAVSLLLVIGIVFAGTRAVGQNAIVESVSKACADMKSMKCDFSQVRTVALLDEPQVSAGRMLYKQPSALKWIYTEPSGYSYTIKDDKVSIETTDGVTEIGSDAGRMFQGLAGIILGCMSGENLKDNRMFQVTATSQDGEWVIVLIPQRREMKRAFSEIVMVFDPDTSLLKRMVMNDQSGGSTEITVSNVSINGDYEAEW